MPNRSSISVIPSEAQRSRGTCSSSRSTTLRASPSAERKGEAHISHRLGNVGASMLPDQSIALQTASLIHNCQPKAIVGHPVDLCPWKFTVRESHSFQPMSGAPGTFVVPNESDWYQHFCLLPSHRHYICIRALLTAQMASIEYCLFRVSFILPRQRSWLHYPVTRERRAFLASLEGEARFGGPERISLAYRKY